jgi:mannose-6-phosphate isomerase-like protein (cupin superfamily)
VIPPLASAFAVFGQQWLDLLPGSIGDLSTPDHVLVPPVLAFALRDNTATASRQTGPSPKNSVNVKAVAATADDRAGVIWIWEVSCGLNANLVRFGTGQGVGEHVNNEVEVIVVGVSGSGIVTVDQKEHALSAGILVFIPKGARRATASTSEDFAYLSVHHRRRPLQIGLSQGA